MSILQTFGVPVTTAQAADTAASNTTATTLETFQNKVKRFENAQNITYAHFDSKNLLTIGYGTLLANPGDGTLKSIDKLQPIFAQAGITLTKAQYDAWSNAAKHPENYKGNAIPDGLELSKEQMSALLKVSAQKSKDDLNGIIEKITEDANNPNGKTFNDLPEGAQLGLLDAMFRGGDKLIGPNVQAAIKENDMAKLLFELRYNSNGDNSRNNDDRNFEMTQKLRDSLSEKQQADYQKMLKDNPDKVKTVEDRWKGKFDEYQSNNWKLEPVMERIKEDRTFSGSVPADNGKPTSPDKDQEAQAQTGQQLVQGDMPLPTSPLEKLFPRHHRTEKRPFDERPDHNQTNPYKIVLTQAPTSQFEQVRQRQQGDVQVDGYVRRDGTPVAAYTRRRSGQA